MPSEREQPNGDVHVPDDRPDAPPEAAMELVIEGAPYPCKDGALICSTSEFAKEFFSRANGLEPRHLLVSPTSKRTICRRSIERAISTFSARRSFSWAPILGMVLIRFKTSERVAINFCFT